MGWCTVVFGGCSDTQRGNKEGEAARGFTFDSVFDSRRARSVH